MNTKWRYVKPIKDEKSIELFEGMIGARLPEDFIEIVRVNNGGRPDRPVFDTDDVKEHVFKTLLSFNTDDLENIFDTADSFIAAKSKYVPVANDDFGNLIAYDKNSFKLYFLNHETDDVEYISSSFSELMEKLYDI